MVEISVIIPARNRSEDLRRCLEALFKQDVPSSRFEVIVCDDGSEEDLVPVVGRMRERGLDVRIVRQPSRGPAAARNLGIRSARGEIIAMTDSDTLPDRSWLCKLWEVLQSDSAAVGVEGRVCSPEDDRYGPLGEGPSNLTGGVYLTCNCAYRKHVLLAIGGFDESFPYPAYEDAELAALVLQVGKIAWQPEALVIHPRRQFTLRTILKKLRYWEFVLIMGYRYGYLAWKQYPVTHPRLRVAALSTIALPLAKLRTAASWIGLQPGSALKLAVFGIVESLGALALVIPKVILGAHSFKAPRRRYLDT